MNRRLTGRTAVALLITCGSVVTQAPAAVAQPAVAQPVAQPAGSTTLISAAPDGTPVDGWSGTGSISADARYVAYSSWAANLVPNDTNGTGDVFVLDRRTGDVERVTVDSAGRQSAFGGDDPAISADGRFVAFKSWSDDLVAGDTNRNWDVFVHDRQTGETTRVSVGADGGQGNAASLDPSISADGRLVAFSSSAANLVAGDTNDNGDVFVRDLRAGVTTRVSVDSAGAEGTGRYESSGRPSISADGRVVVFESQADLDHAPASTERGFTNVFAHDRQTGATTRVSVTAAGAAHGVGRGDCIFPSVSGDGRYVAFTSERNLLPTDTDFLSDVFLFDRETSTTTLVSQGAGGEVSAYGPPVLSADGRYVAFTSESPDLLPGDTNGTQDVFRFDRPAGTTSFVAVADDGTLSNGYTYGPAISADGRHVAFGTERVTNLAPRPVAVHSVFLRDFGPVAEQP